MARIIESVVGHHQEINQLFQIRKAGRWPHAMMFVGPSGIGKKKIALALAQALVCENSSEGCGVCGSCLRIEKTQSESLTIISPDAETARPVIKVDKIRELLEILSLASISQARVVIIDEAHTMNAQASNALLKTLEEPSENVFFILIANDVHQFLPTIRSRTQMMRFHSLSYDQIKMVKPQLPDWMYRSSRGQVERIEMLSSTEGSERRHEALEFFDQFIADENFLYDKKWRDEVKDRSWAIYVVNCWLQMTRDALILKNQTQKFILNTDQLDRLKKICDISMSRLLWLAQRLTLAEKDLNRNNDAVLVFEDLWVRYARVD